MCVCSSRASASLKGARILRVFRPFHRAPGRAALAARCAARAYCAPADGHGETFPVDGGATPARARRAPRHRRPPRRRPSLPAPGSRGGRAAARARTGVVRLRLDRRRTVLRAERVPRFRTPLHRVPAPREPPRRALPRAPRVQDLPALLRHAARDDVLPARDGGGPVALARVARRRGRLPAELPRRPPSAQLDRRHRGAVLSPPRRARGPARAPGTRDGGSVPPADVPGAPGGCCRARPEDPGGAAPPPRGGGVDHSLPAPLPGRHAALGRAAELLVPLARPRLARRAAPAPRAGDPRRGAPPGARVGLARQPFQAAADRRADEHRTRVRAPAGARPPPGRRPAAAVLSLGRGTGARRRGFVLDLPLASAGLLLGGGATRRRRAVRLRQPDARLRAALRDLLDERRGGRCRDGAPGRAPVAGAARAAVPVPLGRPGETWRRIWRGGG